MSAVEVGENTQGAPFSPVTTSVDAGTAAPVLNPITLSKEGLHLGGTTQNLVQLVTTNFLGNGVQYSIAINANSIANQVILNMSIYALLNDLCKLLILLHDRFMGNVEIKIILSMSTTMIGLFTFGTTPYYIENPTRNDLTVISPSVTMAPDGGGVLTFILGPTVGPDGVPQYWFRTHEVGDNTTFTDPTESNYANFPHFVMLVALPIKTSISGDLTEIPFLIDSRLHNFGMHVDNIQRAANIYKTLIGTTSSQVTEGFNGQPLWRLFFRYKPKNFYIAKDGLYSVTGVDFDSLKQPPSSQVSIATLFDVYRSFNVSNFSNFSGYVPGYNDTQRYDYGDKKLGISQNTWSTVRKTGGARIVNVQIVNNSNVFAYVFIHNNVLPTMQGYTATTLFIINQHKFGTNENFTSAFDKFLLSTGAGTDITAADFLAAAIMDQVATTDWTTLTAQSTLGPLIDLSLTVFINSFLAYVKSSDNSIIVGAGTTYSQSLNTGLFWGRESTSSISLPTDDNLAITNKGDIFDINQVTREPIILDATLRVKNDTEDVIIFFSFTHIQTTTDSSNYTDLSSMFYTFRDWTTLSFTQIFSSMEFSGFTYIINEVSYSENSIANLRKVPEEATRLVFIDSFPPSIAEGQTQTGVPTLTTLIPLIDDSDKNKITLFDLRTPENNQTVIRVCYVHNYSTFHSVFPNKTNLYSIYNSHKADELKIFNLRSAYLGNEASVSPYDTFVSRVVDPTNSTSQIPIPQIFGPFISRKPLKLYKNKRFG